MFVCQCKCVNDGGKEKQDDESVSEGDEVSPSKMIDHSSLTLLMSACLMHPLPECTRIMSEKCLTIAHSLSHYPPCFGPTLWEREYSISTSSFSLEKMSRV